MTTADFKDLTKNYNKKLDEMNRRVSRRAMLFEQATQENLRRQVLEKFDEVSPVNQLLVIACASLYSRNDPTVTSERWLAFLVQTLVKEGVGYLAETD